MYTVESHLTKKPVTILVCVTVWVLCDYLGTWRIPHQKTAFVIYQIFVNRENANKEKESETLRPRKNLCPKLSTKWSKSSDTIFQK